MVYDSIKCNKTEWPVGADLMDDLKSRGPMECRGFEFLAVCAATTGALLALALMMPAKATEVQPDTGAVEDRGGLHVERRRRPRLAEPTGMLARWWPTRASASSPGRWSRAMSS